MCVYWIGAADYAVAICRRLAIHKTPPSDRDGLRSRGGNLFSFLWGIFVASKRISPALPTFLAD